MFVRTATAIIIAAGSLTACGDKSEADPSSDPVSHSTSMTSTGPSAGAITSGSTSSATGSGTDRPGSSDAGTASGGYRTAAFGGTVDFGDGFTLHVSKPQPYRLTEKGASQAKPGSTFVAVTITLTNDSGKTVQPSITNVTARSGGADAPKVFDTGVGIIPGKDLWSGTKVTWKEAFAVAQEHDLTVQIGPVDTHEGAVFTD